jgi:hypothetical protein
MISDKTLNVFNMLTDQGVCWSNEEYILIEVA